MARYLQRVEAGFAETHKMLTQSEVRQYHSQYHAKALRKKGAASSSLIADLATKEKHKGEAVGCCFLKFYVLFLFLLASIE